MTESLGYDRRGRWAQLKIDFRREVCVELPTEDATPGMCGKLVKAMYGTRDAPQNWEIECGEFIGSVGFTKGKSTPCLFYREPRNIRVVVYGDDFTVLATEVQLDGFRDQMTERYSMEFKARPRTIEPRSC